MVERVWYHYCKWGRTSRTTQVAFGGVRSLAQLGQYCLVSLAVTVQEFRLRSVLSAESSNRFPN